MKFKVKHKKQIKKLAKGGNNFSGIATDLMTTFLSDFENYSHRTVRKAVSEELNTVKKVIHPQCGTHLVTGCNHIPFDNKHMTNGMIKLIEDLGDKLKGLHLIGDFLDINSLSSHDRGRKPLPGVTLSMEYDEGNKVLDRFDEVLPEKCEKNYMYGNHEDRYPRHMSSSDNSKLGKSLISPEEGLKLEERGYNVLTNWKKDKIRLGNHLDLIHGDIDVFLRESMDEGKTWSNATRINDDPISNNRMQDLIWGDFDSDGDLIVSWRDRRNGTDSTFQTDSEIWATFRCLTVIPRGKLMYFQTCHFLTA